jgi:hypothetical protein
MVELVLSGTESWVTTEGWCDWVMLNAGRGRGLGKFSGEGLGSPADRRIFFGLACELLNNGLPRPVLQKPVNVRRSL